MKTCSVCKQQYDLSFFGIDKNKRDGHGSRCKACQRKLSKLHYLKNKDKYKESFYRNKERRRRLMREAKARPCIDCQIQYPYWVMQFDHLKDKEFNIGQEGYHVGIERLLAEIAKCDVVCANCHAHRTRMRSVN
jgi:hypothetical protein